MNLLEWEEPNSVVMPMTKVVLRRESVMEMLPSDLDCRRHRRFNVDVGDLLPEMRERGDFAFPQHGKINHSAKLKPGFKTFYVVLLAIP